MRLSTNLSNIVMNIEEHNHFFKLCQELNVLSINAIYEVYTVSSHHITYTEGMVEILVDIKYVLSHFNLLLLYYYDNGRRDKFMDKLKVLMQDYYSLVNC